MTSYLQLSLVLMFLLDEVSAKLAQVRRLLPREQINTHVCRYLCTALESWPHALSPIKRRQ